MISSQSVRPKMGIFWEVYVYVIQSIGKSMIAY